MITTEQAIELAREVGAYGRDEKYWVTAHMTDAELTAYANLVRKQTLEEAADTFDVIGYSKFKTPAEELRRMAKGE